jgi:hypothetical protein
MYFAPQYPEFSPRTMWGLVDRVHECIQETRSRSAVQGDGQTWRISRPAASIVTLTLPTGVLSEDYCRLP